MNAITLRSGGKLRRFVNVDKGFCVTVRIRPNGQYAAHVELLNSHDQGEYVGIEGSGSTLREAFKATRLQIRLYKLLFSNFRS